jgi:hypothetical protein
LEVLMKILVGRKVVLDAIRRVLDVHADSLRVTADEYTAEIASIGAKPPFTGQDQVSVERIEVSTLVYLRSGICEGRGEVTIGDVEILFRRMWSWDCDDVWVTSENGVGEVSPVRKTWRLNFRKGK